jgi:predicted dienelactone hydrolase
MNTLSKAAALGRSLVGAALVVSAVAAQAGMGQTSLPAVGTDGPVTLYYPSSSPDLPVQRGRLTMNLALDGKALRGNGRLVVVSHGSGGSPVVHADLARSLVAAGFVVALPEHRGDNWRDDGSPGPDSFTLRPQEVSRAIDAVGRDSRFAPLLDLTRVGVAGQSAGGHTALSMAGGRWSRGGFKRHCDAHLAEDFQACVGLITHLTGGPLDGAKLWLARTLIDWRFDDDTPQSHHDPRVAAVVAGVPYAADFDMASLAAPRVPLGLVLAGQDRWLQPRFHGQQVRLACRTCEVLADVKNAPHALMLSPLPPQMSGLLAELLSDPAGFDRAREVPAVEQAITQFMSRHLLGAAADTAANDAAGQ